MRKNPALIDRVFIIIKKIDCVLLVDYILKKTSILPHENT